MMKLKLRKLPRRIAKSNPAVSLVNPRNSRECRAKRMTTTMNRMVPIAKDMIMYIHQDTRHKDHRGVAQNTRLEKIEAIMLHQGPCLLHGRGSMGMRITSFGGMQCK